MSAVFTWLAANMGTILVCALLVAMVVGLICLLVRDKKKGKSSCCGGCNGCAMQGSCHGGHPNEPPEDARK